jgi:hypothetical protein
VGPQTQPRIISDCGTRCSVRNPRKFQTKKLYSPDVRIQTSYNSEGQFADSFKQHLTNIFDKIGVSNRLELALFALQQCLVVADGAVRPARPRPR